MAKSKKLIAKMNEEIRRDQRRSNNKPDQIDRIREHILEDAKLLTKDKKTYEYSMLIYPKLCKGWTNYQIVKFLKKEIEEDVHQHTYYKYIARTKKIFAGTVDNDPGIEKFFIIQMAKKAYQVAEKKENGRDMTLAAKLIADLEGVFDKGGGMSEIYEQLFLPPIVYSDNPEVLQEPPIDAKYEEVPAKSLPAPEGDPTAQK